MGNTGNETFRETFRAQLVLSEQRQFFDLWCEKAGERPMPDRNDISPADFPRHLPYVSIIEVKAEPMQFQYRLAGTQLREIFNREVTKCQLSDLDEDQNRDYWLSACERIAHTGRPAQGILRGPEQSRDHMVQFWLRLPLAIDGIGPKMILGLDKCIPVSAASDAENQWDGSLQSSA